MSLLDTRKPLKTPLTKCGHMRMAVFVFDTGSSRVRSLSCRGQCAQNRSSFCSLRKPRFQQYAGARPRRCPVRLRPGPLQVRAARGRDRWMPDALVLQAVWAPPDAPSARDQVRARSVRVPFPSVPVPASLPLLPCADRPSMTMPSRLCLRDPMCPSYPEAMQVNLGRAP